MYPKVDSIDQLVAQLLELDSTGAIINKTNITINMYKCSVESLAEIMGLCTLFAKFPQENNWELFKSITAFPSAVVWKVHPRFFVYYTGIYHNNQ